MCPCLHKHSELFYHHYYNNVKYKFVNPGFFQSRMALFLFFQEFRWILAFGSGIISGLCRGRGAAYMHKLPAELAAPIPREAQAEGVRRLPPPLKRFPIARLAAFTVSVQASEPARKAVRLRRFRAAFLCPRQRRLEIPSIAASG